MTRKISRGRPRKYATEQQRRAAKKAQDRLRETRRPKRISGRYFRLVVPALEGYPTDWTWQTSSIRALREQTVDLIVACERSRGLAQYLVAVQRHPGSGRPHLDILLVYSGQVKNTPNRYDYLIKHGNLRRYRTVNAAIINYGLKQDPCPLGTLDANRVLAQSRVRTGLYEMMQSAMLQCPFEFDPHRWLTQNGLWRSAVQTSLFKTLRALALRQQYECRSRLQKKAGFKEITAELITQRLSADQLQVYRSWQGYQTIISHLNQISRWGCHRPHKAKNLMLVGPPNTGKSTLARQIAKYCPVYPLGTPGGWFPSFGSGVYTALIWDEISLRVYPYADLLKLLQGAPMKLPQKGGHVQRADNQLVYMTSNLTLATHVHMRWNTEALREMSCQNLRARITQVVIPPGVDLFLLCKLLTPCEVPAVSAD